MTVSPDRTDVVGGPDTIEEALLRYLRGRTKKSWAPDADLFASGGLSSLFAMELVVHLEKTYRISIRGADLRLDNFRTVERMVALVGRLRAGGSNE